MVFFWKFLFIFYFFELLGKGNFFRKLDWSFCIWLMIFGEANRKGVREVMYTYAAPSFGSINCISKKLPVKTHCKGCCYLPLYLFQGGFHNIQDKRVWNIVTRYCSGYGSLECKFFLREKLRWSFNLTCSFLTFVPIQFGWNISRPSIS